MANAQPRWRSIENFRRRCGSHCSASALHAIVSESQHGMPNINSRSAIKRARDERINEDTPYGPLLQKLELRGVRSIIVPLMFVCPFALIYNAFYDCELFRDLVMACLVACPSSFETPWSLVLYSDEVVPGNQLSHNNHRKHWVIYYSFLEFGANVLSNELAWLTLTCKRSSLLAGAIGGISQAFKALIKHMFCGTNTFDKSGLVLRHPNGQTYRIFAKLKMILQDGDAHKRVWLTKGDAGTKFCVLCRNVIADKSGILSEDNYEDGVTTRTEILAVSKVRACELDFAEDEDVRGSVRRLAAFKLTDRIGDFKIREQSFGLNHCEANMLLDPELDDIVFPVSHFVMIGCTRLWCMGFSIQLFT